MATFFVFLSLVVQSAVAVVAIRAPRAPHTRAAWWTLAAAAGFSAVRRGIVFIEHVRGTRDVPSLVLEELLVVFVSVLLFLGVLQLRRIWDDADRAAAAATKREQAFREGEELWQRIFEFAPDGYILLHLDGRLGRLNVAAAEIAGVDREGSEGRNILELGILDEDGMAQAARNLAALQQGTDPGPAEYTFHRSDGTQRQVEIIGYLMDVRGERLMLTIIHDITRRRSIEAELHRSRLRLEEAQRVAGIVTFEIDFRRGVMWLSNKVPGLESATLRDGGTEIPLDTALSFVHPDDFDRVIRSMAAAGAPGGSGDVVVEYRQRDVVSEGVATVHTTARAEKDEHGDVVRMFGATLDITAIRAAEQEIRTLNAVLEERVKERTSELERAVDELEAFSYSVSHDLRSPLRAMAGYSELVLEEDGGSLSESSREHLERIRASSVRMAGLIDGLLSLSRLTRATRNDTPVDLSEIASGILRELRIAEPDREVEVVVQEGLETVADAGMMSLVLQNLLDNAWKFSRSTPRPRIAFGRTHQGVYFVRDNGVGFDPAQAGKLFRPFVRLHRTDEFEGTGIGLATVDRIVRHHGGRVWAEGHINKGATFWFTLA
ncbi:MAG: ATP-binding protein [Candidatus Binatia bacterium]